MSEEKIEKTALEISATIKAIKQEIDCNDYQAESMALNTLCRTVWSDALHSAYRAGESAGFDFGYECCRDDFQEDYATYMQHWHTGGNSIDEIISGFSQWWNKRDGAKQGG